MSRFKTTIPVDIAGIKAALPKTAFVYPPKLVGNEVVVEWEHPDFETGYTFAVEFPEPILKAHGLPPGVRLVRKPQPAAVVTGELGGNGGTNPPVDPVKVDPPAKKRKKEGA